MIGRLRVRRGDPDAATYLSTALDENAGAELQHRWPLLCGLAEQYWLDGGDPARSRLEHAATLSPEDNGWARRAAAVLPGGASTGSKRSAVLYGADEPTGPTHYRSARGCRVVAADGPTADILGDEALMKAHRLELPFGFDPRFASRP